MTPVPPRILPSGDTALSVEFGSTIDTDINRRVLSLDRAVAREKIAGIVETVPTYRSLLVHYDPLVIGFDAMSNKLLDLARMPVEAANAVRRWRIPVVIRDWSRFPVCTYWGWSSRRFTELARPRFSLL